MHEGNEGHAFVCQFHLFTIVFRVRPKKSLHLFKSYKKARWGGGVNEATAKKYTHAQTEDFCPSSASGLGQLCCGSQPRASSPVSQTAETPPRDNKQLADRCRCSPPPKPAPVCLCVCLYVSAYLYTDNWVSLRIYNGTERDIYWRQPIIFLFQKPNHCASQQQSNT